VSPPILFVQRSTRKKQKKGKVCTPPHTSQLSSQTKEKQMSEEFLKPFKRKGLFDIDLDDNVSKQTRYLSERMANQLKQLKISPIKRRKTVPYVTSLPLPLSLIFFSLFFFFYFIFYLLFLPFFIFHWRTDPRSTRSRQVPTKSVRKSLEKQSPKASVTWARNSPTHRKRKTFQSRKSHF
jgi:hypothetical protein